MKLQFVEPFLLAIFSTVETVLRSRPMRGELSMRQCSTTRQKVTMIVRVSGDVEGLATCGMSHITAQKLISALLGRSADTIDEAGREALTEMTSIIAERSLKALKDAGFKCKVEESRVSVRAGEDLILPVPVLFVPMITSIGRVEIGVSLIESRAAGKAA